MESKTNNSKIDKTDCANERATSSVVVTDQLTLIFHIWLLFINDVVAIIIEYENVWPKNWMRTVQLPSK